MNILKNSVFLTIFQLDFGNQPIAITPYMRKRYQLEDGKIKTSIQTYPISSDKDRMIIEDVENKKIVTKPIQASSKSLTFTALIDLLTKQETNNLISITSGVWDFDLYKNQASCITKQLLTKYFDKEYYISRSKDYINHDNNPGNGLVILDIDQPKDREIINPDEFYNILCRIIPGFKTIDCFSLGSSSSRVSIKGTNKPYKSGYKMYFPINNPRRIPDFMDYLFQRLWLEGYGWHDVSSDGFLLKRSIIDLAMKSPVQQDFCGNIIIGEGLEECSRHTKWHYQSDSDALGVLDCNALSPLTEEETGRCNQLINESKEELSGEIKDKQSSKRRYLKSLSVETHTSEQIVETEDDEVSYLLPQMPLYFTSMKTGTAVTVAEVLENVEKFDEHQLADPYEFALKGDTKQRAIFYSNEGKGKGEPFIYSYAHGERKYFLKRSIRQAFNLPDELPAIKAKEKLVQDINHVFDSVLQQKPVKTVIKATVGLGKTEAVFVAAEKHKSNTVVKKPLLIHFYIPTHKLAQDIQKKMSSKFKGLKINTLKGRGLDNCQKYESIPGHKGKSFSRYFCKDEVSECEYFSGCDYQKQFHISSDVLILPHSYLDTPLKWQEEKPDLVVIDENFYHCVRNHKTFDLSELKGLITDNYLHALQNISEDDLSKINKQSILLYQYIDEMKADLKIKERDYRSLLMEYAIKPSDTLEERNESLKQLNEMVKIKYQYEGDATEFLENKYDLVTHLMNQLDRQERTFEVKNNKIYFLTQYSSKSRYDAFLKEKKPLLYLDGHADEKLAKQVLGKDTDFIEINSKRNLDITQCHTQLFSKNAILGLRKGEKEALERVIAVINRVSKVWHDRYHAKTLLVTYLILKNRPSFINQLLEYIDVENFGGIRGLDCYKEHNVIILGRHQINSDDIILQYNHLFGFNKVDDNFIFQETYYRKDSEKTMVATENYFLNDTLNRVMQQSREVESEQAIARIRDIWSEQKKHVLILGALPLNLKVNRFVSWPELNVQSKKKSDISLGAALMFAFEATGGLLIQAPSKIKKLETLPNFPKFSVEQWQKIFERKTQYILPLGSYESQRKSQTIHKNYYLQQREYESVSHLGIDIIKMPIKFKKENRSLKLIYDTATQTEASALLWAYQNFGEIEGYYPESH